MPTRASAPVYPIVDFLQRRSRRQRTIALAVVGLAAAVWLLRLAARTLLDRWWYHSVTDADVWSTKVAAQLQLACAAAVISALVLGGTVALVLRAAPAPRNRPNRFIVRYRERMGPAHRWVLVGLAALLTARITVAALDQWQPWLLFRHGPSLDRDAPEVGRDLGYHLFRLPFLIVVSNWLRQLLLVAALIGVFGYVTCGALRLPGRGRTSARSAGAHLALLGVAFAAVEALDYVYVRRPGYATNRAGTFDGPGFTELKVGMPATLILALVALAAGFTAVDAVRTGRWHRPLVAGGAWAILHVLLLGLLPITVQRIVVQPAEAARQLRYIAHNLDATITAYRLDAVELTQLAYDDGLDAEPSEAQRDALAKMPLFSPAQLVAPLQVLQGTTATRITAVDLDRYEIDGEIRPVMVAPRNASGDDLPESGWVQRHLVYTHGDGVVAVPADVADADGRPDVDALAAQLDPARPELYFGEGLDGWYAIVGTKRAELGGARFDADTGIDLSSLWRRAVFALSVGEIEPLVSAELTEQSQLLIRRGVRERLSALAPFLAFDGDPYPVISGDRVVWVVDGYTTSSTYPYAQFAPTDDLPGTSDLSGRSFNYLHASVKATVDAYDGTVHLYRTELGGDDDPILDAWQRIFPGLIEPIASMPAGVRDHLHYPPDLFTIQTSLLGRYHVDDAEALFNGSQRWSISPAAGDSVGAPSPGPSPAVSLFMPSDGDLGGRWVSMRPFSPGASSNPSSTRNELAALAIADHDDPEHLRLIEIAPAAGRQVSSPQVAQSAIDADPELAGLFTLLNANGSQVQFGPMTPLPLDGSMVWSRPIIVSGTAATTAPRLYGLTAVSNGLVGQGDDVIAAIEAALAATPR